MRAPSVQPVPIGVAIAAIVVAFLSWLFITDDPGVSSGEHPSRAGKKTGPPTRSGPGVRSSMVAPKGHLVDGRPALTPLPATQLAGADHSPIADELHSPTRTGKDDIAVVMNLFTHYRERFRSYPVGEENAAFVNALSGQNPAHLAFISRNHPAIDAKGQLLDRWGKPYFFHLLSHDAVEVRSAGPDRELYTSDDQVTASAMAKDATLAIAPQE